MKSKKSKAAKAKTSGKKLVEKAGLAIKHEFYLEATYILFTLFEKKLGKVLDRLEPQQPKQSLTFSQVIRRVKHLHGTAEFPQMQEFFDPAMIDQIRTWKNRRNQTMKKMAEGHVTEMSLERLAKDGVQLYKELNKAARSLKAAEDLPAGDGDESG